MPSIPQSLLWISLVVLWLFVLVPMLISKRDAVRRTSDVALSTRVLNTGRNARLLRRGPAAGHRSDPDWRSSEDDFEGDFEDDAADDAADHAEDEKEDSSEHHGASAPRSGSRAVVLAEADIESGEPDYLDVDVVDDDSAALPVGASAGEHGSSGAAGSDELDSATEDALAEDGERDPVAQEYEYVDDSSGLEAPSDADFRMADAMSASRRRRLESSTAAAVSARKYRFRMRVLAGMTAFLVGTAAVAYAAAPWVWWLCGSASIVTLLYLGYLRRQTRIEERLRRRRAQRLQRSRLGVESTHDREFDLVPSRLRRPGAVVLEIDDEDPIFEHLDYAPAPRGYDLPRAAGQ